jgi:hypothetical protein
MSLEVEVVCIHNGGCGFRVHDRYYADKSRFTPGYCARCGGLTAIVEARTSNVSESHIMTASGEIRRAD